MIFLDKDADLLDEQSSRSQDWFDLDGRGEGCPNRERRSQKSNWKFESVGWNYSLYNSTQG